MRSKDPHFRGRELRAQSAGRRDGAPDGGAKRVKNGQNALAWLLHKGDGIVPMPGTRQMAHLEENVGAAQAEHSVDDIATLDVALTAGRDSGPRYSETNMARVDR